MTRSRILTAAGAQLPIPDAEIDALGTALGNAVGSAAESPLVALMRKLDPRHPVLVAMDRISRDHGYVRAGTDERIQGWASEVTP